MTQPSAEKQREYRKMNPERYREYRTKYQEKYTEYNREYHPEYYRKNREKLLLKQREYDEAKRAKKKLEILIE